MRMEDIDLKHRMDELFFKLITVDPAHKRDLMRMWHHCKDIQTEISKEDVQCRRLSRETPKSKELKAELSSSLDNLEQYLMFAMLLKG